MIDARPYAMALYTNDSNEPLASFLRFMMPYFTGATLCVRPGLVGSYLRGLPS